MALSLEDLRAALGDLYRVDRELGRGGMATVYLAKDVKHERPVAIKVLDPDLAEVLGPERFLREIRIAAALQHPHILPLLDSGAAAGFLYYVMPYVKGESLRARLDAQRQLPLEEAARLAIEVAGALDYSHRQGMVHRDIKPDNILLADGHAMVSDFGIARAIRTAGGERLTQTGMTLGSPPYMSPEQIVGGADLDGRSDLYSLGCVLYEMLAGQRPFMGPPETMPHQHLNLEPRPVRELRPTVPAEMQAVLTRLLAKSPADRFATAGDLAGALTTAAAAIAGPGPRAVDTGAATTPTARPASPIQRQAPPGTTDRGAFQAPARRWSLRVLIPGLAVVTIAIAGLLLWRAGSLGPGRSSTPATPRRWVWLADFEGPPEDPSLATTARDLVAATLDQSEVLATLPQDQMLVALRRAGLADTARLPDDRAREMAFRSGVPVVVEGKVGKLGPTYAIVLRAANSEDGRVVCSANAEAASEQALAPTIARLARDLRRGLGERPQALSTPVWTDAATPSFEAFRLFVRARTLLLAGDQRASVVVFRQALALDPEFAAAWAGMATALSNQGYQDSATTIMAEALRHPRRLSPIRRLEIEAKMASYRGDVPASIAAYDALLDLNPPPVDRSAALNNKAILLASAGRNAEALDLFRESAATFPIEPPQITLGNMSEQLIALKRFDEVRAMLPQLRGAGAAMQGMVLAMAERSWERADSLAARLELGADHLGVEQIVARHVRLSYRTAHGDVEDTRRELARMRDRLLARGFPGPAGIYWFTSFWLSNVSGLGLEPLSEGLRGEWRAAAEAERAAFVGDSAGAMRAMAGWPGAQDPASREAMTAHALGLIDWRRGRWSTAIERMRGNARGGIFVAPPTVEEILRPSSRWIVAESFRKLGARDSAIAYFHLLLDPPRLSMVTIVTRGHWEPFARSELVSLYAEMGRAAEARREWDVLAATCTRPDARMLKLLDDTRGRLQAARALGTADRP